MPDKVITAKTPLEKAALKAMFTSVDADWFGNFTTNVMRNLYEELGLLNDDKGAMLDLDELSDLMVSWERSLR